MELREDFKDLLKLLNANGVEYLVVGGFALSVHAKPRFTADLDVLVKPDPINAARVVATLNQFGVASLHYGVDDFSKEGEVFQVGVEPGRVDIITSIKGVPWEVTWKSRVPGVLDGISIQVLGRKALILNKLAVGRPQDLLDVVALKACDRKKPRGKQPSIHLRKGPRRRSP